MKKLPSLAHTLAFVSLAALLVGCKTTSNQGQIAASYPTDVRQRHPIAVREAKQTLTVFIGDRRGGLTATQRGEVGALAPVWRREATGGFVIEVPYGSVDWLLREILKGAGEFVVIEPDDAREAIRSELEADAGAQPAAARAA